MKKNKVIKVTEAQIREAEGESFNYIDSSDDTKNFNGQSSITAQGKLDGEENAEPVITDRIGRQRTPQAWARYRMYGNISRPVNIGNGIFNESASLGDKDEDDIPDHYENVSDAGGLDTLSDGNDNNNICVVPNGVSVKLDALNNAMSSLTPKQKAMVINSIFEKNDLSGIPNAWKKTLMYKINSTKDNPCLK